MYRQSDLNRKLGYRFRCSNGHKINTTKNTFLEYVHTAGELGYNKVIQMINLWLIKDDAPTIQQMVINYLI